VEWVALVMAFAGDLSVSSRPFETDLAIFDFEQGTVPPVPTSRKQRW
jgi:hypothetical protein